MPYTSYVTSDCSHASTWFDAASANCCFTQSVLKFSLMLWWLNQEQRSQIFSIMQGKLWSSSWLLIMFQPAEFKDAPPTLTSTGVNRWVCGTIGSSLWETSVIKWTCNYETSQEGVWESEVRAELCLLLQDNNLDCSMTESDCFAASCFIWWTKKLSRPRTHPLIMCENVFSVFNKPLVTPTVSSWDLRISMSILCWQVGATVWDLSKWFYPIIVENTVWLYFIHLF